MAIGAGPIAALILAGVLSPVRAEIGTTNVALLLAALVAVVAFAGRMAGFVTAVTAALAYNYFHTAPYHSLRIGAHEDIITVVLLVLLGLAASEISAWRRRAHSSAKRRLTDARMLEDVSALIASGASHDDVWAAVSAMLSNALGLGECRFETMVPAGVQSLARSGSLVSTSMRLGVGGFELPPTGVSIPVEYGHETLGHIVLIPAGHTGTSIDTRRAAIALADQLAVSMAMSMARATDGQRSDRTPARR